MLVGRHASLRWLVVTLAQPIATIVGAVGSQEVRGMADATGGDDRDPRTAATALDQPHLIVQKELAYLCTGWCHTWPTESEAKIAVASAMLPRSPARDRGDRAGGRAGGRARPQSGAAGVFASASRSVRSSSLTLPWALRW